MTACDYCLSHCSDDGHSLDDEGCGPSRECFHVDLGGHDEGNHLGMPEDDDPPGPAPRVYILRELDVVPVPAGGQDTQLEQIREMQAKLNEEAGQLVQLRQNIKQEWAGRALAGEARPESGCSGNTAPSDAGAVHHRGAAYPRRAQESPRGCRDLKGRELCLPKARVPPGASHNDFPIRAGSLGPHRAHAGRDACGPGSPRQRAPSSRPSSPPR
jgi:hypothetical protein